MDTTTLVIIAIVSIAVNSIILYLIIASATEASKRAAYEGATLEILAKLAAQMGVPREEIQKTMDRFLGK